MKFPHILPFQDDIVLKPSHKSVYIGDLSISIRNPSSLAVVTSILDSTKNEIQKYALLQHATTINQMLLHDTFISCRINNGNVFFGIFHKEDKQLLDKIDEMDFSIKSFENAMNHLSKRTEVILSLKSKGIEIPEDEVIRNEWEKRENKKAILQGNAMISDAMSVDELIDNAENDTSSANLEPNANTKDVQDQDYIEK